MGNRIVRAKMGVAVLGLADRLRVLWTGRVIVYATGVKPYCELSVATRLPANDVERAEAVEAVKRAREAARPKARREAAAAGLVKLQKDTPK